MINSTDSSPFNLEQSQDLSHNENNELRLSLIRELNAALTLHNDGITAQLDIKHTYPMGIGMFES